MFVMLANREAAARNLPIAHGRGTRDAANGNADKDGHQRPEVRRPSETRLQAPVVADRKRDEHDPYADVPCTD